MLERFTESFNQLKKSISLKYIDVSLRQRCEEMLSQIIEATPQAQICRIYITKIQEVHESFLQSISGFIDSFPHYASEYQQQFETIQNELASVNKVYEEQKRQWQNIMQEMNEKFQRTHKEIIAKQEDVRYLHIKIEERDAVIDNMEKQSNQYLKKVQIDLEKQQKALEESYFVVQRLQQEIQSLKYQNDRLLQAKNAINVIQAYSPQPVRPHVDIDQMAINKSYVSSNSHTFVKCSIGSHASHEGLSQFQQIQNIQDSREILDSVDYNGELPPKCETLKEMLNMSVQKEYKLQYNKCDSIQNKISKENFKPIDIRDEGSKQNHENWAVNNSLEFICKDSKPQSTIKEFNLHAQIKAQDNKVNNPYYFYFLIASQNAKINSQYFEDICSLCTLSQWQVLNNSKTPLHQWEQHLQHFLLKEAKII